jgi:hypothetical protein
MAVWIESYNDFLRKLAVYDQEISVTPEVFMRYAARGLQDLQRQTQIIKATKQLQSVDGRVYNLVDPVHGDDVDVLLLVVDPWGSEVFPQTRVWHQDTMELAQRGHNEFPHGFSYNKKGTYLAGGGPPYQPIENRVYWRLNHSQITIYPPLLPTDKLELYYTVYFHPFTQTSVQWQNWFPLDTNFWGQFATTAIPSEIDRFEEGWTLYAVAEHLRNKRSPYAKEAMDMYQQYVMFLLQSQQNDAIGLTSPYRLGIP